MKPSARGLGPGCAGKVWNAVGLRPLPGGALEQRVEVQLRVLNPNDRELEIDGVDFTLEINGGVVS